MFSPTTGQLIAAGRHVVTFAAGAASFAASVHFMTADQAKALVDGVTQVSSGLVSIGGGLAPVAALISGYFASRSASPKQQALSLIETGHAEKIVAPPEFAAAVPSDKVVPN